MERTLILAKLCLVFNTRAMIIFSHFNDLPLALSKKVSATDLYADDTTIYDISLI